MMLKSYLVTSIDPSGKENTHLSRSASIQQSAATAPLYISANKLGAMRSIHQVYPGTARKMVNGESAEITYVTPRNGGLTRPKIVYNAIASGKQVNESKGAKPIKKAKPKKASRRRKALGKSIAAITADTASQGDIIPLFDPLTPTDHILGIVCLDT